MVDRANGTRANDHRANGNRADVVASLFQSAKESFFYNSQITWIKHVTNYSRNRLKKIINVYHYK